MERWKRQDKYHERKGDYIVSATKDAHGWMFHAWRMTDRTPLGNFDTAQEARDKCDDDEKKNQR